MIEPLSHPTVAGLIVTCYMSIGPKSTPYRSSAVLSIAVRSGLCRSFASIIVSSIFRRFQAASATVALRCAIMAGQAKAARLLL
jgi:hypothetical protein